MGKHRSLELPVHRSCLEYLQYALPGAVIHHSPNGFGISLPADIPDKWRAVIYGLIKRAVSLAKLMGMMDGFPDLLVIYNGVTMGFEVKAEGGTQSIAQRGVQASFMANGARYAVVRSIDDVKEKLQAWGVI
jgi:hypothetical protein